MSVHIDQLGKEIAASNEKLRIVSLVPSQTELLFDLGLEEEVVGITKFCIHPEAWFRTKTRVGGTKNVNINKVRSLNPTLIIANKEENTKADLEALEYIAPVWTSDVRTIPQAFDMIKKIGCITRKVEEAKSINAQIKSVFDRLVKPKKRYKVVYIIWQNPIMVAASDTFIDSMLQILGYENACGHLTRYPEFSEQMLIDLNPDCLFLSSEPFPFQEKHIEYFQHLLPQSQILLVDGELFSWYGSRLIQTKKLEKLLTLQE